MDNSIRQRLVPGAVVQVTQQIVMGQRVWTHTIRGQILSFEQKPTGSWFAHALEKRLWLDRLTIRQKDGQVSVLNLDACSAIKLEELSASGQEVADRTSAA